MIPHLNAALLVSMLWPFVLVAVAWGISVWALRQPDPQTELVRRFTGAAMRPGSHPAPEPTSPQPKKS